MTNLEAIALRLKEEREKRIEQILGVSGSAAINKSEYNVNFVDKNNPDVTRQESSLKLSFKIEVCFKTEY